jgi:hypothetical protein
VSVVLGVCLGGFDRVIGCVLLMPMRDLSMVSSFLVRAVIVMTGRLTMMASCMLKMVGGVAMMVSGFF